MNIIKQIDLFDLVDHSDLLDIASQSQIIDLNQGDYLYQKNDISKYFYMILEGDIQIISDNSQLQQQKPVLEQNNQNQNIIIQPPQPQSSGLISHRRSVSFGGQLLNTRSQQGSPVNIHPQFVEQVLSIIGQGEFVGIYEFIQQPHSSSIQPTYSYSMKIYSKHAKLLQINGEVLKKLKVINSPSFNLMKNLVLEQKRIYEEREKLTEAVKLNFKRQVHDGIIVSEKMKQINSLNQNELDKFQKLTDSSLNPNNNSSNNNSQFHQLYCQIPFQERQNIQKRRGSYNERQNFTRLSIESIKNNINSTAIYTNRGENRSSSSSSKQAPSGNIILPLNTKTITSLNEGSKQSIGLTTIENNFKSINYNNSIKASVQCKKHFDIFNTPEDPICQSLSLQLTEQMAKNKKRYFIQAMRELEKSRRTNPYTHQQQNTECLQQNKSNDMLRRSPNVRERSILEKYIKIKKKTEFKTDIDRKEERLLRIQQQQSSQQLQQELNDVLIKESVNIPNNDSINSKKQLRILPDNNFNNKLSRGYNQTKMDYYYDHPVQQTPFKDPNQCSSGNQTPINLQQGSYYNAISEEDQFASGNTLSITKLHESYEDESNIHQLLQKKNNQKQLEIIKDENQCLTPIISDNINILRVGGVRSSLQSQLRNNSSYKMNIDQMQNQPLSDISKKNNYQMNSNDSHSNINHSKLQSIKRDHNSQRRLSEQQSNSQNIKYKLQPNQKLCPINLQSKYGIEEQENQLGILQEDELTNMILLSKKQQTAKRNSSGLRSVSVKHRQSQNNNKRVLLII